MVRSIATRVVRKLAAIARVGSRGFSDDIDQPQVRYRLNQLQAFEFALRAANFSFTKATSILDFGCRTGRLTQHMFELAPQAHITGCDILRDAVEICQSRLPSGQFAVNEWCPPLPFDAESFDLILSYSVFTHLTESNHAAWLKELARVLRPGGFMAHTTHSYAAIARMAMFSPAFLEKFELGMAGDAFMESNKPYHYVVDNPRMPEYGVAIIKKEYILERWPRYSGCRVAHYGEAAIESNPAGCHDVVVLQKEMA
jgi:SAM-dependent methyltransferase